MGGVKTVNTTCDSCGRDIYKNSADMRNYKHHFCNSKCSHEFQKKGKMVECGYCGKTVFRKMKDIRAFKNLYCSVDCRNKGLKGLTRSSGPTPELTRAIRQSWKYRKMVRDILAITNLCEKCDNRGELHVHHKKEFIILLNEFVSCWEQFSPMDDQDVLVRISWNYEPFWDVNNCEVLCKECHMDIHKKKEVF